MYVSPLRSVTATLAAFLTLAACSSSEGQDRAPAEHGGSPAAPPVPAGRAEAIFAGGCFWCMEAPFEQLRGVDSVTSGYTGGRMRAPTYHQVSAGGTGHAEAVRVIFDPSQITYARLLEVYWRNVDPTQTDGQFCDHGDQYRTAIFVVDAEQRRLATASREQAARTLGRRIVTEIEDATTFWVAEDYHQDFHRTNPTRYRSYRAGCGRDARLRELWGTRAAH